VPLPYYRWTVEDFHQMASVGLLDETDRVELIEGAMIDRAPIGSKHAYVVDKLAQVLTRNCGSQLVRVQNPIRVGERSEPQPDIAVVKGRNYMEAHPIAADVLLAVEVSDSTLEYDLDIKFGICARHGIPEVWLLDVNAGEITVYRDPTEGQYRLIRIPTATESVSPMLVPAVSITLTEVSA
jgi:Uma2 family endonuclease